MFGLISDFYSKLQGGPKMLESQILTQAHAANKITKYKCWEPMKNREKKWFEIVQVGDDNWFLTSFETRKIHNSSLHGPWICQGRRISSWLKISHTLCVSVALYLFLSRWSTCDRFFFFYFTLIWLEFFGWFSMTVATFSVRIFYSVQYCLIYGW